MHNTWLWSTIFRLHHQGHHRIFQHLNEGPMINHIKQENHDYKKIRFQILAQAPTHETNTEFWLKRHENLSICQLGTLNKLSNKDLNKIN